MAIARPTVSVCIPAYRAARHIGFAIESVLRQTFVDYEVVVVDNASPDETVRIVEGFSDPRIRLLRNSTNIGVGGNFNRAVREARGRYVKVLCHDDLLYPTCLATQVAVLDDPANRDVALVCCYRDVIDDDGTLLLRGRGGWGLKGKLAGPAALRRVARSGANLLGEPAAVLFRAEAFEAAGGFDGGNVYMIDLDLWCRLMLTSGDGGDGGGGGGVYAVPQTLCAFRVSRTSLSTTAARSQAREARRFFQSLPRLTRGIVAPWEARLGCARATMLASLRRMLYLMLRRHPT